MLVLLAIAALCAAPAFEVASVKRVEIPPGEQLFNINLGRTSHGELTLGNASLSDCLQFAYSISTDAQLAGPDWIRRKDIRYDILAKAAPGTPREQLKIMLQGLLTERFQLKLHREQREASYLALAPGKKGLKITEVDPEVTLAPGNPNRPG